MSLLTKLRKHIDLNVVETFHPFVGYFSVNVRKDSYDASIVYYRNFLQCREYVAKQSVLQAKP